MNPEVLRYLDGVPILYKGVFMRAFLQNSRAAAVKAMCLQCSDFDRDEVTYCTVERCPLHLYRPYQIDSDGCTPSKTASAEENEAS